MPDTFESAGGSQTHLREEESRMSTPQTDRIWFLDNVRYWTVLVVVALHVGVSQKTSPWGWAVEDPRRLIAADWLVIVADSFIMPVLFFVAGYFALPSFAVKGPGQFIRSKVTRLLIPGALVVIFLNPVFRYVYHYTRNFDENIAQMSYWQYWPKFFKGTFSVMIWEPGTPWTQEYDPLHIWFVTVLFLFFLITCVAAKLFSRLSSPVTEESSTLSMQRSIVLFMVLLTVASWACSTAIGVLWARGWVSIGPFLNFFSTDIPYHALYFSAGIYAFRQQWFRRHDSLGSTFYWLVLCVALSLILCYLSGLQLADSPFATSAIFQAGVGLCKAFLCMSFLGFLLAIGQRWANSPSKFNRHMAAHSYLTYLLHMTVVVLVQLALLQWTELPGEIVLAVGISLSLIASHLVAMIVGSGIFTTWPRT
jgi:acyltransferase-like protein